MRVRYRYVSYGAGPSVVEQMQQMHQLMHQMMVRSAPGATGAWQPPADAYETDRALIVQVELAGVHEDEIDITLFSDHLSVTGTRRHQTPSGPVAYHLAGILYGHFRLELPIVASVVRDAAEATFENGLLTITLLKTSGQIEPTAVSIQSVAVGPDSADADGASEGAEYGA